MSPDRPETPPNTYQDRRKADMLERLKPRTIYQVIRKEGETELARPLSSLWWSGVAAGIALSSSILLMALLHHYMPQEAAKPVVKLGYCVGFVIVIMGRLQLFTENTITAVLPLLAHCTWGNLGATGRLWAIVFSANLVGAFFAAFVTLYGGTAPDWHIPALLEVSRTFTDKSHLEAFLHAIPAGFFVAAIVWLLPSADSNEFGVIVLLTYLIALGDFSHVIAGSFEIALLIFSGELPFFEGFYGYIFPAFLGNTVGGTVLFAFLAYAQVREEI